MSILLFEDDRVPQLNPTAVGKPAFALTCGSYRLIDLLIEWDQPISARVRPHLQQVVSDYLRANQAATRPGQSGSDRPTLLVNARLVPSLAAVGVLQSLSTAARPAFVESGDRIAAALLPAGVSHEQVSSVPNREQLIRLGLQPVAAELPLLDYPHDLIRYHQTILAESLAHRLSKQDYKEVGDGVFAAPGATLGQYSVTDTKRGPILLDAGATVGPYCYLSGPVYLGPGSRVLEHAALKDGVAIGHTTKIGGEVEASTIEPYTNKQHHGFLGHSYLGSWINLGAGTCNSDLKNTYGQVNVEYHGTKVATGMQFVGAIVGDYAKTAINTGIFTGKTIGVCSMVYGFVTTNVPSFVNYARLFGQVTEAPVEVMVATQRRMFARRGVEQRPCDIQLLHDMYDLTARERQMPGEPLSLEPLSL